MSWNLQNSISGFDHNICFNLLHSQLQSQFHQAIPSSSLSSDRFSSMAFDQSINFELDLLSQDIDCILQSQSENLRYALHEQGNLQLSTLLSNLETKAWILMRQNEENLEQAKRKTMELQQSLKKAELETQTWHNLAKAKEAIAIGLNNTLQQLREKLVMISNRAVKDAESACCESCDQNINTDDHNAKEDHDQTARNSTCKSCKTRISCVLFLPCRHLCSCKYCEAVLGCCPVCECVKEETMDVLWV